MSTDLRNKINAAYETAEKWGFPTWELTREIRESGIFQHGKQKLQAVHRAPDDLVDMLGGLIINEGLRQVLEIGTLYGFGTVHFAEAVAAHKGSVTSVDWRLKERQWATGETVINIHETAERFVEQTGQRGAVELIAGNSMDILPRLFLEGRQYDLAFIDGSHVSHVVYLDFINADNLVRNGGYIVLDDVADRVARQPKLFGGPNALLPHIFASNRYDMVPITKNTMLLRKRTA